MPKLPGNAGTPSPTSYMQASQQACLVPKVNLLNTNVCCVSETLQSSVTKLASSDISSWYFLHTPGDEAAPAAGHDCLGTVLSGKAEAVLLGWIPVSKTRSQSGFERIAVLSTVCLSFRHAIQKTVVTAILILGRSRHSFARAKALI